MTEAEHLDDLVARAHRLPPELAAAEARAFFESLPPSTARELAESRPDQVGALEGAPAQLRYRANHLRLLAARARLRAAVADGTATDQQRIRLETVEEMLTPVSDVGIDEAGRPVELKRDRQFLSLNPDGQGRVVEVLGDLGRAHHVAVLVPGMGNSLESLRSQSDRAAVIREEAGPNTAAVLWLDYDSPQTLLAAADKQRAWEAASALRRFQAGLDTEVLPQAGMTLIGHSYGSVVVGQGLRHGVRTDRVILTGSPGIDPEVRSAADLVPPGTPMFVARAPGDFVSYSQWHGTDPASFPDVVRMQTAGGSSVRGHQEYYRPNSESLRNVGRVVRGDLHKVTTTATSSAAETRLAAGLSWAGPLRDAAGAAARVFAGVAAIRGVKAPPAGIVQVPDWTAPAGRPHQQPARPEGPDR